jgi:hypothetical protein
MLGFNVARKFRAGNAGHEVVGDDEVNRTRGEDVQGLFGGKCRYHLVAGFLQHQLAQDKCSLFIIDT